MGSRRDHSDARGREWGLGGGAEGIPIVPAAGKHRRPAEMIKPRLVRAERHGHLCERTSPDIYVETVTRRLSLALSGTPEGCPRRKAGLTGKEETGAEWTNWPCLGRSAPAST